MAKRNDITVEFEVREIIYDIMNKTHLTGHAREASGERNFESASYMQASEDEQASYQIRRSVSNAFAELKEQLGEYLSEEKTSTTNLMNSVVDKDGKLILTFNMPSNFHKASIDSLGSGCHQYIVNKAIGDWFILVNKPDAADYVTLASAGLETAKRALYKRSRPTRPTYSLTNTPPPPSGEEVIPEEE